MQYYLLVLENKYLQVLLLLILVVPTHYLIKFLFKIFIRKYTSKTETALDDKIIQVIEPAIFWSLILIVLSFSLKILNFSFVEQTTIKQTSFTLLTIIWGSYLIKTLKIATRDFREHMEDDIKNHMLPFLENFSQIFVFLVVFLIIFNIWNIDITPLLAAGGFAGVALAFASKDLMSNLFGGLSVFFDQPYKLGDYVIIEDKYRGEVVNIGMRSTKIRTRDNVLVTVPNSVMVTNAVINETGFDPRLRIRIPLQVSTDGSLENTEKIILKRIKKNPKIMSVPKPVIRYRKFSDAGVDLEIMASIAEPAARGRIKHQLIKDIQIICNKEGIDLPAPRRDIYILNKDKKK